MALCGFMDGVRAINCVACDADRVDNIVHTHTLGKHLVHKNVMHSLSLSLSLHLSGCLSVGLSVCSMCGTPKSHSSPSDEIQQREFPHTTSGHTAVDTSESWFRHIYLYFWLVHITFRRCRWFDVECDAHSERIPNIQQHHHRRRRIMRADGGGGIE